MSGEPFNWHEFLKRWQAEWFPREDEDCGRTVVPLGRPGADEAVTAAAEDRLGRRLPPSYREFLAVSDGWHVDETAGVYQLGGAADIDWFRDPYDMTPLYEENLGDNPRHEDVLLAGMWRRALRLETDSDASYALLDPGDSDQDGEWALYVYRGWSGELPVRYSSFRAYMEAMYRRFHADRAGRPGFVNATTRAQDAHVEEARLLALRGRYEEALPLLEEALAFGRPQSAVLLNQLRHLLAPRNSRDYGNLVNDSRYLPEVLPLEAMTPARGAWRLGGDDHWLRMITARGADQKTAEAVLSTMRDGTHRYAPPGPWGRAVAEARESARWGMTDTAWRVLRDALPLVSGWVRTSSGSRTSAATTRVRSFSCKSARPWTSTWGSMSTYTTRDSGACRCATWCTLSAVGRPLPRSMNCRTSVVVTISPTARVRCWNYRVGWTTSPSGSAWANRPGSPPACRRSRRSPTTGWPCSRCCGRVTTR